MATSDEAVIFLSRIERYYGTTFPDEVRKEYLLFFQKVRADVLSEAIARLLESTSHVRPPPTRAEINEKIQQIYDKRAQERKAQTPTLVGLKPSSKLPPRERQMAVDAIRICRRLLLDPGDDDYLLASGLAVEMANMAQRYSDINGAEWTKQAADFEAWRKRHEKVPTVRRGNLHPLPEVDRIVRPEMYDGN